MIKRTLLIDKMFWWSCIIMIFYSSYRYPFQINNSLTSPTYSDTPFYLQVGKYLLLILFSFLILPVSRKRFNIKLCPVGIYFVFPVILFSIIKWVFEGEFEYLLFPFFLGCFYFFVSCLGKVYIPSLSRMIKLVFIIGIIVDITQVLLFFFYKRLPALAYHDSFSVRFGSFLDDPNGYGILCCAFIGWVSVYYRNKPFLLFVLQAINVAMILLTQSMTAGVCMFIVLLLLYYRSIYTWLIFTILCVFTSIYYNEIMVITNSFLEMKAGSIDAHLTVKNEHDSLAEIIFGGNYMQQESWWLSSYMNYGAIFSAYFFMVITLLIYIFNVAKYNQLINVGSGLDAESVYCALKCFIIAFLVGMINLPLPLVFPLNFIFFTVLLLAGQKKILWA